MKSAFRITAALVLAVSLAACGGAASPSPSAVDVTLSATEFTFDPNTVEVAAGSQVRFTLANKGTLEHDLTIDDLNIQLYAAIGDSPTITTGALAAGSYAFHCSIPGHTEAGMTGTLTVK